jgi:hypothetical protein
MDENNNDDDYVIINNIDLFNFIYKFNSQGTVDKYIQNMIMNNSLNNCNNDSFISYFNMEEYVNDIRKSYYNKEENIMSQFEKDYYRQNVKLNGYKYQETKSFIEEINRLLQTYHTNSGVLNISLKSLIILLCCQSSFYLSYQILVNLYEINSENRALICDSKNKLGIYIDIVIDDKKIIMELNNTLLIRDIDKNENTHRINTTITVELDIKKENKSHQEPHICVFNWTINRL